MSHPVKALSLLLFAFSFGMTLAAEPTPKVLIIGIDGCRPDALNVAKTPNLDALVEAGTLFQGTDIRETGGTDKLTPSAALAGRTCSPACGPINIMFSTMNLANRTMSNILICLRA